jgi:hypothetical protein
MKKFLLLFLIMLMVFSIDSQNIWQSVSKAEPVDFFPELISSHNGESVVAFNLDGFSLTNVNAPVSNSKIISVPRSAQISEMGAPDMAQLTAALIIPDLANMEVEIIETDYYEIPNIEIAPSKGDFSRQIDPETIPYTYGPAYQQNAWYPGKLAELSDPHIFRDFRGAVVVTYPFQYNPVTKVLRVFTKIIVKVKESALSKQPLNPYIRNKSITGLVEDFHFLYSNRYLNFSPDKYNAPIERGRILVISHDAFIPQMMPYVQWKNQIGFPTEIVGVSTIGNSTTAIKNYVTGYYNSPDGLAFLLIVGDHTEVVTYDYGGSNFSDNWYGDILGNDSYPEVIVGRFSATASAHVQTQVQRTIEYEKADGMTGGWQTTGIGIARNEGAGIGHDGGEADYVHVDNIRTRLLAYHYSNVYREYDGSVPGVTNTTAAQISSRINDGASIINFCNHGSVTGWSVAGYSNSHVNGLTNVKKLPFIWAVACVNGQFTWTGGDCFAETWLKATNASGEPTGAVAVLMSTINQPWLPPMDAQDEFNRVLCEHFPTKIRRTFGAISASGIMHMLDIGPSNSDRLATARTWTTFGDPSVMLRTDDPVAMTVSHPPMLNNGETNLLVSCNTEDAFVTLTHQYQIIGTGLVSGGFANITFPPVSTGDTIHIAVTAYNAIPYLNEIPVDDPSSCPSPFALSQTAATDVSATVQWTNAAGEFEIEWGLSPHSFTGTPNVTSVYSNTHTILGLQPGTTYDYRVKAICGPGDESNWSATGMFVTEEPSLTVNPALLNFSYVDTNSTAEMQYVLSGQWLDGSAVSISAPGGFQVSLTSGTGFTSVLNVPYVAPNLPNTIVYVRFEPSGSPADYTGLITNLGGGASSQTVEVQGTSVLSCDIEITISGSGYLDETSFTLTDDLGTAVLSGGPFAYGSTNTFTHQTVNPPYTFYLETMGSYNDNIAGYEIKRNGTTLHSGTLQGGQQTTVGNIVCFTGPSLAVSPSNLSFGYVAPGNVSASQTYDITGEYLDPGPVTVTAPSGFEVSLDNANWFGSVDITYTSPNLGTTQVYVRFVPTGSPSNYNDVILNAGGGGSVTVSVTGSSVIQYCSFSANCTVGDDIHNFSTTGGIANITNMQSGCSPGGYGDFTHMIVSAEEEGAFDIHVQASGAYSQGFAVWIDWNQNGDFTDPGEAVWNTGTWGTQVFTGTINIPAGAPTGPTRMRVMAGFNCVPSNPCQTCSSYGEAEDYTVEILPAFTDKTLEVAVFLEGLYDGAGMMRKTQDVDPVTWTYVDKFGGDTADVVTLELWSTSGTMVFSEEAGLSVTGIINIVVDQTYNSDYYIYIRHRNSIAVSSANPVSFAGSTITYNFSTAASQAYFDNQQQLGSGIFGLFAGDVDNDASVSALDMVMVDNASRNFMEGYQYEDVNGDAEVGALDMIFVDNNSKNFVFEYLPF